MKRAIARQELVEHDTEAVSVGPPIDQMGVARSLFGAHVGRRAQNLSFDRQGGIVFKLPAVPKSVRCGWPLRSTMMFDGLCRGARPRSRARFLSASDTDATISAASRNEQLAAEQGRPVWIRQ